MFIIGEKKLFKRLFPSSFKFFDAVLSILSYKLSENVQHDIHVASKEAKGRDLERESTKKKQYTKPLIQTKIACINKQLLVDVDWVKKAIRKLNKP